MHPSSFEYFAPRRIEEAFDLLAKHDGEAKILAGGQSLIPLLKLRLTSIPYIVDISRIEEMNYIRESHNELHIGALTTIDDIENSASIRGKYPIIFDAASNIADPLVRNRGTIGGNISHGDPSNDMPAVMLALGAKFTIASARGDRVADADGFFIDTFTTALEYGEILREITIPGKGSHEAGCYIKNKKTAGDFSVAGIAVQIRFNNSGTIEKAGIGMTSVSPKPIRATRAENYLKGKKVSDSVVREASRLVVSESNPSTDFYGTVEFKKQVLAKIAEDAIYMATDRAEEN